ncbi:MAG: tRNA-dihydrouridine synthase [Patescibacteria group bacterium]
MKNFWKNLPKPFYVLAPMADVTDAAFRQIINKYGKPDVFWTEFVAADGLAHPKAREKLMIDLKYSEGEHPIVAQIFGGKPENIKTAAALCQELGFDGVDINMGCPDRAIERQCAGSAMIKNPELAKAVIRAAKEGAPNIPISVKTRIGYNKNEIDTWIREILSEDIAALTVHLRTRKEMSDVPAHWELMKSIVEIRDELDKASSVAGLRPRNTLIIGNGDATDLEDAKKKVTETGCDGVMLGRAIFGNPWLFNREIVSKEYGYFSTEKFLVLEPSLSQASLKTTSLQKPFPSVSEKLRVLVEHTKLFEEMLGEYKNFAIMKKHYKAYVNGFDGAKELRMKLMEAENADEIASIVNAFCENLSEKV